MNTECLIKFRGKVKVVPVLFFLTEQYAMKEYWGSGDIAPTILTPALDGSE
jgi:hypothetical protein